jgi:hypothetical protein
MSLRAIIPILASERTAAQLLDLKPAEFLALVEGGHLPPPRNIGGFKRWDVADLRRIGSGSAIEGLAEVQW